MIDDAAKLTTGGPEDVYGGSLALLTDLYQLTMAAGGLAAVTGFVWFLATRDRAAESGPMMSASAAGDATIGWSGRF